MSDNDDIEWIAPADAERLLWAPGHLLSLTSRERIIQRAREGFVRAHVRDVVKRKLAQSKTDAKPEFDERGVQKLGAPLPIWEWPIEKERRSDVPLEEDDWLAPGLSDVTHPWWETGDLELHATNGSREGVSMFGIEFCKADIERMAPRPQVAPEVPMPAGPQATAATSQPAISRPIAKDALRQWLSRFYDQAQGPVDWKRDA